MESITAEQAAAVHRGLWQTPLTNRLNDVTVVTGGRYYVAAHRHAQAHDKDTIMLGAASYPLLPGMRIEDDEALYYRRNETFIHKMQESIAANIVPYGLSDQNLDKSSIINFFLAKCLAPYLMIDLRQVAPGVKVNFTDASKPSILRHLFKPPILLMNQRAYVLFEPTSQHSASVRVDGTVYAIGPARTSTAALEQEFRQAFVGVQTQQAAGQMRSAPSLLQRMITIYGDDLGLRVTRHTVETDTVGCDFTNNFIFHFIRWQKHENESAMAYPFRNGEYLRKLCFVRRRSAGEPFTDTHSGICLNWYRDHGDPPDAKLILRYLNALAQQAEYNGKIHEYRQYD